ncbi:MAG: hypothetical protein LUD19_06555 [Clostridia bacterium]|nr:hypothetical protein [Clostridia bacterium]
MEPINNDDKPIGVRAMEQTNTIKKRTAKKIGNYTSLIIGTFLILVVIFVFTTDVVPTNSMEWATLGLTFCVLLFCSYSMYVTFADSGTKAGKLSDAYITTKAEHDGLKNKIITNKLQTRLPEFCRYYIAEELKTAKNSILAAKGINYDTYTANYIDKDETALKELGLSDTQIKVVMRANKMKPIHLTPEMILKQGRGDVRRNPLGVPPEGRKCLHYATKMLTTFFTSALTGVITLEIIADPSWSTVASCLLKLLPIVLNGFMGYKMGFENIAVSTVNYMNDQSDLMHQFLQYTEKHPDTVS